MGLVPWHSHLNPTRHSFGRKSHFHLSKAIRVQRVRHNKQPLASCLETSFSDFSNTKGILRNLKMILHLTPPALSIITLLFLLLKILERGSAKEVYIFLLSRLYSRHSMPRSQPSPNSFLSTQHSSTLGAHLFHKALPNDQPSHSDFPHEPTALSICPFTLHLLQWQAIIIYLFECKSHFPN